MSAPIREEDYYNAACQAILGLDKDPFDQLIDLVWDNMTTSGERWKHSDDRFFHSMFKIVELGEKAQEYLEQLGHRFEK